MEIQRLPKPLKSSGVLRALAFCGPSCCPAEASVDTRPRRQVDIFAQIPHVHAQPMPPTFPGPVAASPARLLCLAKPHGSHKPSGLSLAPAGPQRPRNPPRTGSPGVVLSVSKARPPRQASCSQSHNKRRVRPASPPDRPAAAAGEREDGLAPRPRTLESSVSTQAEPHG